MAGLRGTSAQCIVFPLREESTYTSHTCLAVETGNNTGLWPHPQPVPPNPTNPKMESCEVQGDSQNTDSDSINYLLYLAFVITFTGMV